MASFSLEINMQRLRIQLFLLQAVRRYCQKKQDMAYLKALAFFFWGGGGCSSVSAWLCNSD